MAFGSKLNVMMLLAFPLMFGSWLNIPEGVMFWLSLGEKKLYTLSACKPTSSAISCSRHHDLDVLPCLAFVPSRRLLSHSDK
jgi:hypothetical protein